MKHKLIRHLCVTIFTILCIVGILTFIFVTETGLKNIVYVAAKFSPGELQIANLTGRFIGPIHADQIHYKDAESDVLIANLNFDWDLSLFFLNELYVKNLTFTEAHFNISSPKQQEDSNNVVAQNLFADFSNLRIPLRLKFDNVKLDNITLNINNTLAFLDTIKFSADISSISSWHINLEAMAKHAALIFDGKVDDVWQVQWNCRIAQIKEFVSNISGNVTSAGNITGLANNPIVTANTEINNFQYGSNFIKNLQNKIAINFSPDKISQIDISARNVGFFGFTTDNFSSQTSLQKNKNDQIEAKIIIPKISLTTPYSNFVNKIILQKISSTLLVNKEGLSLDGEILVAKELAPFYFKLALPEYKLFAPINAKTKIKSDILFKQKSLDFAKNFFPQIKNLTGDLFLHLFCAGTFNSPRFQGELQLNNVGLKLPLTNVALSRSALKLNIIDNKISYNAIINALNGSLQVLGSANITAKNINNETHIWGSNFPIVDLAEYKINASPDLHLNYKNNAFYIDGKIYIPNARIEPRSFTNVVTLPKETVYAGKEKSSTALENLPLHSNVQVSLGDDVKIDLMNINGKLTGEVNVIDEPSKATIGQGSFTIKNGFYNLYKQKLEIVEGQLKFSGNIQNPELYLRSVRRFKASNIGQQEFIVGMLTRGKLDNLTTTLFSEPAALSQTDIFSYLILGIPSKEASGDKAQMLLKAASFLRFDGSGPVSGLMEGIQKQFGLSELTLGSETTFSKPQVITEGGKSYISTSSDTMTNTALMLGKYLSPRLYVGYSMGLMDAVNVFRIRYFLTKSWSLQSESSTAGNGGDVLYTVERD